MKIRTVKDLKMIDYSQAKIFKIISASSDKIFISFTCEKYLSNRMFDLRRKYNLYLKKQAPYQVMYDLFKNNDEDIVLLENFPCKTKDELMARVHYFNEQYKSNILQKKINYNTNNYNNATIIEVFNKNNSIIIATCKDNIDSKRNELLSYYKANISKNNCLANEIFTSDGFTMHILEKYPCNNKEELNDRIKYWENKHKIVSKIKTPMERSKEYREINKEKIKEQKQEYYIKNKDTINEKQREYYEKNKDDIIEKHREYKKNNNEKCNEKYNCECGSIYIKRNKSRHIKTKSHKQYLLNQLENTDKS